MSLNKYLPEVNELANIIVQRLRPYIKELFDETLKEIEINLGSGHEVAALVRENFQRDYEKLSHLPPSCHKVFNFILQNGASHIHKIRQELKIQGEERMPLSTIYDALGKLREKDLVEEVEDRWRIKAKGFLPFC
jgi:hypothetical protein